MSVAPGPRPGSFLRRTVRAAWAVLDPARERRVALLRNAAGMPIPIFLTADGTPCAAREQGTIPNRAVVCSIPKAGTYLVGELLRRLGLVPTGLHLSTNGLTDYRFATREEGRNEFIRFAHPIPLERSLPLVRSGQYAVGHLECTLAVCARLAGCKVVFAYRDLRDGFVSWLRFHRDTRREAKWRHVWETPREPRELLVAFLREAGEFYFTTCRLLRPWIAEPAAFPVRFETLLGDDGPDAQQRLVRELAAFLGHADPAGAAAAALPGLLTATTLTSSGSRTKRAEYWSDEAEELFQKLGGEDLNRALGYDREPG